MYYALIVAALSLFGAAIPLRFRPGHAALQLYLSLAAGALLGAGLFHLLPEASAHLDGAFGLPALVGILLVVLLQRYVAPHTHEVNGHPPGPDHIHVDVESKIFTEVEHRAHEHDDHGKHQAHAHAHSHEHQHSAAPALRGLIAILALSVHSFFDGVAIAAATSETQPSGHILGLSVFLSVMIHKPMDGLSVSVLLLHANMKRATLWWVQIAYAALVPIGALMFHVTSGAISDTTTLTGCTLAFSGGTFLAIALTDLLPELHFHKHDRNKLSAALLLGLAVMWITSVLD